MEKKRLTTKKVNLKRSVIALAVVYLLGACLYYYYPNFTNHPLYFFAKDLITFALSIAGIYIAAGGLFTWKSQIEYTKGHEVAENLHHSLLKLRDAIKHVRNPAIFPSESYEAVQRLKSKYPNASVKEVDEKTQPYVYELRWEEIRNASTEVDSNLLMAEVLWGREICKLMIPLNEKVTELNVALKQNFQPDLRTWSPMKIHDAIYDKGNWTRDEEDDFGKDVNRAITQIMDYVKSKVS